MPRERWTSPALRRSDAHGDVQDVCHLRGRCHPKPFRSPVGLDVQPQIDAVCLDGCESLPFGNELVLSIVGYEIGDRFRYRSTDGWLYATRRSPLLDLCTFLEPVKNLVLDEPPKAASCPPRGDGWGCNQPSASARCMVCPGCSSPAAFIPTFTRRYPNGPPMSGLPPRNCIMPRRRNRLLSLCRELGE
jgi:hypothetical protein